MRSLNTSPILSVGIKAVNARRSWRLTVERVRPLMEASEARGGRAKPVADGERSATETRGGGRLAVWIRSIELWFSYFPTSTTTDSARQKRVIQDRKSTRLNSS